MVLLPSKTPSNLERFYTKHKNWIYIVFLCFNTKAWKAKGQTHPSLSLVWWCCEGIPWCLKHKRFYLTNTEEKHFQHVLFAKIQSSNSILILFEFFLLSYENWSDSFLTEVSPIKKDTAEGRNNWIEERSFCLFVIDSHHHCCFIQQILLPCESKRCHSVFSF